MNGSANAVAMGEHDHSQQNAFAGTLGFIWHFLQMVIVMMLGMGVYHLIYAVLDAPLGLSATLRPYPAVRQFMMDLSMAIPMVPFMYYKGSTWRRNIEMVVAMIAGPLVFLVCLQLGLHQYVPGLAPKSLQAAAEISMYLGMLAVMLYRRNEHAAHGSHRIAASHDAHAEHRHEPAEHRTTFKRTTSPNGVSR